MPVSETSREIAQMRPPFSSWLGMVVLFAIFGAIVLAILGPSARSDDYEQKRAKARAEKLKTMRDEDTKALSSYGWVDKTKGTVRVPIERAMQLTVADLAAKKPAPAGPIAAPSPAAPAPEPAATATPAKKIAAPKPAGTPKATTAEGIHSEARGQPAAAVNPPQAQTASPTPTAKPSP